MLEGPHEQWDWSLIRRRCVLEALRILRRREDAEEVVQEALTRAWRSRSSCRTPDAPLAWCLQITRNEALRLIGRRRVALSDPLDENAELEDERARGEDERTVERVDLARALRELSAHDRHLIDLRYRRDCSHPEIATELAIPEATARVRLHRAHNRLKALLDDRA
jgi:RNA polymerase sigma factor (sigma-70 family)